MKAIITVPQPCHENWHTMQPARQGRHCNACTLTVVDFTGWELPDISNYLHAQAGKRVCGRFHNTQLNQPFDLITFAPEIIAWKTNGLYKIAAMIVVCFAMATTSCSSPDRTESESQIEQNAPNINITGGAVATNLMRLDSTNLENINKPLIKDKRSIKVKEVEGMEMSEGQTMGVPNMEEPGEIMQVPVPAEVPKYQPPIGPPEDDGKQIPQGK